MTKLTEPGYWETVYEDVDTIVVQDAPKSRIKRGLKKLLGPKIMDFLKPYGDYLLWDVFFAKYMPAFRNLNAIEIGSAPGTFLVRLRNEYGINPFGVEYTEKGARINKAVFEANGIAAENLIHRDFFSDDFQNRHRTAFDVVISRGFIEHFTEVGDVIDKHVALLKPGGLLVVMIPNLRGVYFGWTWLFNRPQLPLHNLKIMKKSEFTRLFAREDLAALQCNYYGTFNFWMFTVKPGSPMGFLVKPMLFAQRFLNLIFRLLFGKKGCESAFFSPDLIFIGKKKP